MGLVLHLHDTTGKAASAHGGVDGDGLGQFSDLLAIRERCCLCKFQHAYTTVAWSKMSTVSGNEE
jgi:hypothetical protein